MYAMALATASGEQRIEDIAEIADIVWKWKLFAQCPQCGVEAAVISAESTAFIKCEFCGSTKTVPISLDEVKRRVFAQALESCM
jgi:hypothetical protein